MSGTIQWKDWLAGLSVDVIGGTEKIAVLDGTTAKNVTANLLADFAIDKLVAAAAVTPTAGDAILVERSGAEGTFDLAALASYVVASGWAVASEVDPATNADKFLVQRAGTVYELDIDIAAAYINGAILDLTPLTAGTPGSGDLLLFGIGASPRKITLANLETKLWTDFAAYVGALGAVTTTAANDKFYCIQGGTPKFVTPEELKTYVAPNVGDVIAPITQTPGKIPQWHTVADTLTDGLQLVTAVRTTVGGASDTAVPTELAVRNLLSGIDAMEIVAGTAIGAALDDLDLIIVHDESVAANRKSPMSRVWTYIVTKLQGVAQKNVPVDADRIAILDSAAANDPKLLTVSHLWNNRYLAYARAIKLDTFATPDDTTNLDATDLRHGLMSKADKIRFDEIVVIDEDDMVSNLDTHVPTQQSVKAYVDAAAATVAISALDIDGGTAIGAALVDSDLLIVNDLSFASNRKAPMSRVKEYAETIKLDAFATPDDNTNLNATSTRHGLLPKLENTGTKALYDDGTWQTPPGASGGEANTASNVGSGQDVFKQKSAVDLQFRGIAAGSALVTVTTSGDNIEVDIGQFANLYVDAGAMVPCTTNGATAGTNEYVTNDIDFDFFAFGGGATEQRVQFKLVMPEDWDRGTIKAKFYWSSATGSSIADTVEWGIRALAISNDDAIDAALGTAQTVSDAVLAADGADLQVSGATAALTVGGTPALGDMVAFVVHRNTDGTDDMTEDAWLLGVSIQYRRTNAIAAW